MPGRADVMEALESLAEVFPLKADATIPRLADVWLRVLGDVELGAFRRAVRQYERGDHRWFPTPGKIRALALLDTPKQGTKRPDTPQGRYLAWEQDGGLDRGDPCPVCGSVLDVGLDAPMRRIGIQHDHERHTAAGVTYSGYRGVATGTADGF